MDDDLLKTTGTIGRSSKPVKDAPNESNYYKELSSLTMVYYRCVKKEKVL